MMDYDKLPHDKTVPAETLQEAKNYTKKLRHMEEDLSRKFQRLRRFEALINYRDHIANNLKWLDFKIHELDELLSSEEITAASNELRPVIVNFLDRAILKTLEEIKGAQL